MVADVNYVVRVAQNQLMPLLGDLISYVVRKFLCLAGRDNLFSLLCKIPW